MAFDSIRSRLRALATRWSGPHGTYFRGTMVTLAAIAATKGYAAHLGKTYPVKDWVFWKIATMWGWGFFLSLACVSAGHLILSRALRITGLPTLETVVQSAALGLLTFVLGMYAGGFARQFNAVFAVALPTVMLLAGARPLLAFARERRAAWQAAERPRDPARSAAHAAVLVFGIVGVVFVYLGAMTPDAINFDSSWSHIPIATDYARHGRIIRFDGDYTRNVPHLASIVHTWAMIVPKGVLTEPPLRWMLAQHLEFFFFLWTLGSVAAMTRWLLDDQGTRGTWAAFFLFPAIFVYDSNLGGGADHYLAFFAVPFFLAAMRAMRRFDVRECAMAGAFGAGALLTKYQAIYLFVGVLSLFGLKWLGVVGAWIAARVRRATPAEGEEPVSARALLWGPLALGLAIVVISSPHFLKNWVFYHNPVYPFAQDVFASRPTTPNAAYLFEWLFKDYDHRPHGTFFANVKEALQLCFTFSFVPHYTFTKGVPNMGSLFTLCMPFAFFVRSPKRLWLGYVAGIGALFAWGMIFRVDRHLQTFIPLLVATTAAVIVRTWELGWIARVGLGLLVGLQVVWGGDAFVYQAQSRIVAAFDLIKSGYDGRVATRWGNRADQIAIGKALPPDAKVLLHMYRPNLGLDRDLVLDWAGQQALIFYENTHGPRSVWEMWRAAGITHLLHVPGHRAASTKQEDVLFTDFIVRYGQARHRFGGEELVTLPAEPPPPDHPFQVLSLGLAGYRDGLYPVEAMKTYESVPEHREKFPAPARPWPRDSAAQQVLVEAADAVTMADRWKPDPAQKTLLDQRFTLGQSYAKSFAIYVRKGTSPAPKIVPMPGAPAPLPLEEPTRAP